MSDLRRTIAYGLILNLFLVLTLRDLLVSTKSSAPADAEDEQADIEKSQHIPQLKIMNMERSAGPAMKFLFW